MTRLGEIEALRLEMLRRPNVFSTNVLSFSARLRGGLPVAPL
jgi:hypothetical protein